MMLVACSDNNKKSASELLKDPVMEEHIYNSILSDKQHLTKFMDKMMADAHSMKMLINNGTMMKTICMSEELDSMVATDKEMMESITSKILESMKKDSIVCDHTCNRMMENEQFRNYLNKRRIEKK
jgi:short-subunit dehydrogenase involved in D-alanine esterification of teichoic acids